MTNEEQAVALLERMAPSFGLKKVETSEGYHWVYANEYPNMKVDWDADISWKKPTQAQIDALTWVCKKLRLKVPTQEFMSWHSQVMLITNGHAAAVEADIFDYKLSVFEIAEAVVGFTWGLGYSQLKGWSEKQEPWMTSDFQMAAALLKGIIDSGYDKEEHEWWPAAKNLTVGQTLLLVSFKDILQQLKQKTLILVSTTLEIAITLILADAIRNAKKKFAPTGLRKCIHPECEEMVDIGKKKSGACCKEHMNYECVHPSCIAKAKTKNWERYTHPFGTKIAEEHWQYRKK